MRFLPWGGIALFESEPGSEGRFLLSRVDPRGARSVLSRGWADWWRPSWSAAANEILFPAGTGGDFALYGVRPSGGPARLVARVPGDFRLWDVDTRGRMLLERGFPRGGVLGLPAGETTERDVSWLDFSGAVDLSADGTRLLLSEIGGGFEGTGAIALRRLDGSPAVNLGDGEPLALSADGRFAVALPRERPDRLLIVPTGSGERRERRDASLPRILDANWFGDGRRLVVVAGPDASRARLYAWEVDGSKPPRPFSGAGRYGRPVASPDGRWVAAARDGMPLALYGVDGTARPVPGGVAQDEALRFTSDGRALFVRRGDGMPAQIDRIDLGTGVRQKWKELRPADPAGVFGISSVVITPDGRGYAYTFSSSLGSLYLAEGIR